MRNKLILRLYYQPDKPSNCPEAPDSQGPKDSVLELVCANKVNFKFI